MIEACHSNRAAGADTIEEEIVAAVVARRDRLADLFSRYPWASIRADLEACERLLEKLRGTA